MRGSEGSKRVKEGPDGQGGRLRDSLEGSETATDVLGEFRRDSVHDSFVSKSVESLGRLTLRVFE